MLETAVENHLKHVVEAELGGRCIKLLPYVEKGLPDRMVLLPGGEVWFIETKQPSGRMRKTQERKLALFERLGFRTAKLWSKDEVDTWWSGRVR